MEPIRLCVWSGPRNISTALMYSFAQRNDTVVYDEPLYAHYLVNSPARDYHPGAGETIATMENDGDKVVKDLILGEQPKPVAFFKMMTHFLCNLDQAFLRNTVNVLLTRNPRDMLPSYAKEVKSPTMTDVGYAMHIELLERLREWGQDPPILDSTETLKNPRSVLNKLCQRIGLPFDEAMLSWNPGPRPEDGCWAKYWYHSVHKSTGFQPYAPKTEAFPEYLEPLYRDTLPYYETLANQAICAD